MAIVVERSFSIERGAAREFERLSREGVWPYMEARGCKILGLFTIMHGGPSNEIIPFTAYDSMAHWEATRDDARIPGDANDLVRELHGPYVAALAARRKLTVVTSTRVLRPLTTHVTYPVRAG
jgi:NIPSNAP